MVSEQLTRKVVKLLHDAGFQRIRTVGSHSIWQQGSTSVSVPDGHRTISPGVVRQIMAAIQTAQEGK